MIYTQSTHSISSTTPNDYTVPRHLYKVQFSDHVTSFPAIMTQQFSHTAFTYLVSTSVLNIWINPKTKTFSGLFHRHKMKLSVPDPDLEIWGGNRSSRPLDKGGGGGDRSPKFFFSALRASVSSKTKGEGPSLWIRHCLLSLSGLFTNQKRQIFLPFHWATSTTEITSLSYTWSLEKVSVPIRRSLPVRSSIGSMIRLSEISNQDSLPLAVVNCRTA